MTAQLDQVRVGFIGAGRISDLHAIEYQSNPDAAVVAIADIEPEVASERARAWGFPDARIYTDYRALLDDPDVNTVEILLPHHLHCDAALAAMDSGKHVSLQKPMTTTIADADRLVDRATAAAGRFRVFENFIFYPPIVKAKELIDSGAIGEPISIRIKSNPGRSNTAWKVPAGADAWRQDRQTNGGGPLAFDDGHHKFALGWHFMGQADEVHAWIGETPRREGGLIDAPAIISWKFPGNRFGHLELAYSPDMEIVTVHYPQDDRLEITGTAGVIAVNRGHGRIVEGPPLVLYAEGKTEGFSFPDADLGWEASFIHSTRHFIDALRGGDAPRLNGEDGRAILKFTLAAQRSAEVGRAVRIEELDRRGSEV
ncbi:MAG: Gfo/Idh/MocA family oxidoreductase [Hyphomicrobiales bacterium]|nr:Gfo/Idh/MocA family oxidoreductase [Hyphomicrobiales bacterium]